VAASTRHFVLGNRELVTLAGADHELTLPAISDLAGDGIIEEAMLEPFDDKPFEAVERLADLPASVALEWGAIGASAIVQQSLHVFDSGGEGQRPNADGVTVEGHYVVPPRGAILKDEHLALAFGAKVEQFVARAAQEAGEIKVAGFERAFGLLGFAHYRLSS
jgi:hypothetical protein